VARTTTEVASSGDECVVALAAFVNASRRGARVPADHPEIFWQQTDNRLRWVVEMAVAKISGHGLWPGAFSEEQIDHLGHLERERWTGERRAAGWARGCDAASNTTSHLLAAWREIGRQVREVDHQLVRALPDILTGAGRWLRRVALLEEPATGRP